jgi:hypothetical protein
MHRDRSVLCSLFDRHLNPGDNPKQANKQMQWTTAGFLQPHLVETNGARRQSEILATPNDPRVCVEWDDVRKTKTGTETETKTVPLFRSFVLQVATSRNATLGMGDHLVYRQSDLVSVFSPRMLR